MTHHNNIIRYSHSKDMEIYSITHIWLGTPQESNTQSNQWPAFTKHFQPSIVNQSKKKHSNKKFLKT